jgi:molecular chaperone Hsp33
LLGRSLKFDGRLTLQMQGAKYMHLLVMQIDHQLNLRGLARWSNSQSDQASADFAGLVDGARLAVTIQPAKGEQYQSIVPLMGAGLAGCLEAYYGQSVQLPTVFLLSANSETAAGLMLQAMPERQAGSGRWRQLLTELAGLDVLKLAGLEDSVLLSTLFPGDDMRLFDAEPVAFRCDCSMQRTENVLRMFGTEEMASLISEPGNVDVRCEFCNQLYEVTPERIHEMIAELAVEPSKLLH